MKPHYKVVERGGVIALARGSYEEMKRVIEMHRNCRNISKPAYCSTLGLEIVEDQSEYPATSVIPITLGYQPFVPPKLKY